MTMPERSEMLPSHARFSPTMSLSSVDLPAPLGPTSAMRESESMPNDSFVNR